MARLDTLQTLPEWAGQDEMVDGWMFDTEPGTPPDAQLDPVTITMPLIEMLRAAHFVTPSATFDEVASVVARADGEPVVVAESGRPLGVVRSPDVVRAMVASDEVRSLSATALMSSSVYCLRVDAPADRALELFNQRGAREVAVIDASGSVIGVVMPEDVTRALARAKPPKSSA